MTPSVTDKTPISPKNWRRHTDPPSLWIAVTIGSLSLHLLVFWFMRSSEGFKPWFPQQSQAFVPIELIDISPQETPPETPPEITPETPNLQAQKISPKPPVSTQQSVPEQLPKTTPVTPNTQETEVIDSDSSVQEESTADAPQPDTEIFSDRIAAMPGFTPTPIPTPTPTPTPTATPTLTPTPIPTPTIPVGDLPWNRRQEVELGKGTPLPTDIPSIPSEQPQVSDTEPGETANTPEAATAPTPPEETANTPEAATPTPPGETANTPEAATPTPPGETANTPEAATAPTPPEETANTSSEGGAIATVAPLLETEVRQLIQEGRLRPDGLPDVLAIYKGSNTKQLDATFQPGASVLQPAQFLVSLVIDQNGNFQQATVLEIEPVSLQSEKRLYEEVANDIFKNDNFLPAQNNDGSKPELSNLFVRITIQPVNRN
ncbi:hypothetical protein [Anabaena sp. CCY 9614]